ncbi:transporter [Pseudomonas sp. S32]|uniref:transporter n=1 Tax=Pseudomonas sp. S32 TaxID=2767448 RepID=UPI0019117BBD|nr:transporter [Pseudomonas sp. S32]MBK5006928.1 transporter [Pseudomonas sp. S32]
MSLTRLLSGAAFTALPFTASAVDLNARDFFTAPAGTELGILYLPATRARNFHGPADVYGKAELRTNVLAARYVYFTDVCGVLCTPQVIIPYADIDARLPGATAHSSKRGIADPQIGATLFFINDSASRTYSGLFSLLTVPLGEYHSSQPDVSPGGNRWGLNFVYNYTMGIGKKWVIEGNAEAQFFGKNDDYAGQELKQKPVYRFQGFASYDFTDSTFGSLKFVHGTGGDLRLNNRTLDDTDQKYTQIGFEIGHWFTRRNQLLISVSRNVETENGFHGSQGLLRIVHAF